MKESKYLEFHRLEDNKKTKVYSIISKHQGTMIGSIQWYGPWRQYCLYTAPHCVFNNGCLQDVMGFIGELMAERKRAKHDRFYECLECGNAVPKGMTCNHSLHG